jgi:endonuclease-3
MLININKIRAHYIRIRLNQFFPKIRFPLKNCKNPYQLLIASILSAKCRDKKVNFVTKTLFAKLKNPWSILTLSKNSIKSIIKPCGIFNRKEKFIRELSIMLIKEFNGDVPKTMKDLLKLPGIGRKSASIVLSQSFKIPTFPIDTHVYRLSKNWKLVNNNINSFILVEKLIKDLFPINLWKKIQLQFVEYGKSFCPPNQCNGRKCIICNELFKYKKFLFQDKN